ncbi:Outer membrane protein TolC [Mucilaginibacter mallensis]|uniref:Outer membrane protein TolC n=1 Tax=Mucilaginibacter mallensis TaxID=652787 RepID=A0A1H1UUL0_MUCMA|nr:TolC family protein [Mucilaginibacter mallensis]SDS75951.1 Outer membrane protein TolC [Mucilaginibacter mallensis]
MRNTVFIMALFCAVAVNGYAQQAPRDTTYNFSIQDCVNYAYQHQHDVANAALDVKSAGYKVQETIGQGLPQISGSATFQDYVKTPNILFPDVFSGPVYGVLNQQKVVNSATGQVISATPPTNGSSSGESKVSFTQKYNLAPGINISQIIFDPNYIVGLQARKTYKQLYERSYTRSKIEVNVSVTKAYYQVLVSAEHLRLLQADIDQLKQQMDETAARNKQGFVEKIDVDRITYQYNSLVTTRENTARLLVLNYELLKFQIGMPIDQNLTLTNKLVDIKLEAATADPTIDTAVYRNRIEYNLLETQKRLDEYNLKSTKGQFLPKLLAVGNYAASFQSNSFSGLYNTNLPSAYIGLTLSVPIFTGFQHLNQVRQSQITVLKAQNDLDDMQKTVNLQISQSKIAYINGLQTLNDQKLNRALAQEVLRVSKIKYEQGVGSSIEVTQAQTAVEDADNTYIQGLYDALVSKVDLDKAYGRIQ